MKFATAEDIPAIEHLCNLPEVRRWNAFDGAPLATGERWVTPPNMALIDPLGCFLLDSMGEGRYSLHANLIARGRQEIALCFKGLGMLRQTDARELIATIPWTNDKAALFACQFGFKRVGILSGLNWKWNGIEYPVILYRLTLVWE
jgi:hypothetical protein